MNVNRMTVALILIVALSTAINGVVNAAEGVVNINSASIEELMLLPRVGPSVAQRIVDHRAKNGDFKTTDDLLLVRGIGEATYALIQPYVSVSGATTLNEKVKPPKKESSGD